MPNTKSAQKAMRAGARRAATNKSRLSRVRNAVRKVEDAIVEGDKKNAQETLRAAQPELMRGAGKGVIAKRAASRKMSRLSKRIKSLAQ